MKRSQIPALEPIAALEPRVSMSYASTHILIAMSAADGWTHLSSMRGVAKATAARARGISKSP